MRVVGLEGELVPIGEAGLPVFEDPNSWFWQPAGSQSGAPCCEESRTAWASHPGDVPLTRFPVSKRRCYSGLCRWSHSVDGGLRARAFPSSRSCSRRNAKCGLSLHGFHPCPHHSEPRTAIGHVVSGMLLPNSGGPAERTSTRKANSHERQGPDLD
jgi:hypothetical protein